MKLVAVVIITVLLISLFPMQESFEDSKISKTKARFWGDHKMVLYGEPQVDFKVDPLTWIPYTVDAKVQIGDKKVNLYGGGMLKPNYYYYDRQCKSLNGFEYLYNYEGDFVRMDYHGKVCYLGSNVKTVNLIFKGSNGKGIFGNAIIEGTFSGNSDKFEGIYDLSISSILVYNNN